MVDIETNLKNVRDEIEAACKKAGRDSKRIRLVAVSKTHAPEMIIKAFNAGQKSFGESYAQEYIAKSDELAEKGFSEKIEWHYIGSLQTNKVKYIMGRTALIHAVDRLKLAEEIGKRASAVGIVQPVLVEVNVGDEESKSGVVIGGLYELLMQMKSIQGLSCLGLMAVPPYLPPEEVKPYFVKLKELAEGALKLGLIPVDYELSMGMSGDFQTAIECGATIVRIGTAIFGARNYS